MDTQYQISLESAGLGERQRTQECQIPLESAGLGERQRTQEYQIPLESAGLGERQRTQEYQKPVREEAIGSGSILAVRDDSFERELAIICNTFKRSSREVLGQPSNEKRLICNSVTSDGSTLNHRQNFVCSHGPKCSYAHSLEEQRIDEKKLLVYRSILDQTITMSISEDPASYEDIYRGFITASSICEKCYSGECTGGYNCRNGACCHDLLVCNEDLITGRCSNETQVTPLTPRTIDKFKDILTLSDGYLRCCMGHHLSQRNLPTYGMYLIELEKQQQETQLGEDSLNSSASDSSFDAEIDEILAAMSSEED